VWGIAPVFLLAALIVFAVWLAGRSERLRAGQRHAAVVTQVTREGDATG